MGIKNSPALVKRSTMLLWLSVILIVTCIAFSPSIKNDFTNWDDPAYILNNPLLTDFPSSITIIFSSIVCSNYHPLTVLSNALEYKIWGLNPTPFHVNNVILHLLNTLLVFWFIFLLSGKKIEVAFIVSLFFGIHPMHVESVVWVSERKDVLYTFFFIGALIAYYYYLHKAKNKLLSYLFVFVLFLLSLLSKVAAVTFPLILFLVDIYSDRKFNKWVFIEKIPFFICALVFGIVAVEAQASTKAFAEQGVFTLPQRFMFANYGLLAYIVKLFLPLNLSAFYPYPSLLNHPLPVIFYVAPVIVLLLGVGIYKSIKHTKIILFGFLFYLTTIALTLQFISVGSALMADRYSYIPYIGLLFMIGMGYSYLHNKKDFFIYKYLSVVILFLYAGIFSYLTFNRCKVWKNSETLWTDVINKHPDAALAYKNRGKYYADKKKYDLALLDCNIYISLKKDDPRIYSNRGIIYSMMEKYDKAIEDYTTALTMEPGLLKAFQNRGFAYLKQGDFQKTIDDYNEVIKQTPNDADAFSYRATANFNLKNYDAAIGDFNKSIEFKPDNPNTYYNRGVLRYELKQYALAIEDYNKALSLNARLPEVYNNSGFTKNSTGDFQGAIQDFDKALSLDSLLATAYNNRGYAKLMLNDLEGALSDVNKAIKMKPDNAYAFYNRSLVYLRKENTLNACNDLHTALLLGFTKQFGNEAQNLLEKYCKSRQQQ